MANVTTFEQERASEGARRLLLPSAILLVMAAVVWLVWSAFDEKRTSVQRKDAPKTMVDLLPPPPPPPPPPPEPKPQDTPKEPSPTPAPQPEAAPPAPAPVSIDAPATSGADAFGLRSGPGGGMGAPGSTGTCVGANCGAGAGAAISDAFYRNYLSSALQNALRRDKTVNRERFQLTVNVWIGPDGNVSRAELIDGSGNGELDQKVLAALRAVAALRTPQGVKFPQRAVVRGSRGL